MVIITAASEQSHSINSTGVNYPHLFFIIIFIMKTILLLTVLLSGVLAFTAAGALEPKEAPVEAEKENQVEAAEPAQEPVEPQEEKQDTEVEAVPEEGKPEVFSAGEVAAPIEGRFFFCPSGWVRHRDSCYLLVYSSRYWASAVAYCHTLGATLPSAHDLFEYSFLQDLTRRAGYTTSWLGGLYFQGWRWLDQTKFDYQFWYSYNSYSRYPCMYLNSRVGWSNSFCTVSRPFICQKRTDTC